MQSNKDELISVIMPVWNGEAYLAESIESIRKQDVNTEIIIVDDGSTDQSGKIAAALGCRVITIPHSGISRACNTGLRHMAGDYFMILDQDDVLCDASLSRLRDALRHDSTILAVAAQARDFISADLPEHERKKLIPRTASYHGLMTGCVLLRRAVRELVGGFNESFQAGQAVDYLLRIEKTVTCIKPNFVSVMRRLHARNTSRTMRHEQFGDYGAILRSQLTRQAHNG